ncbi:MAG: DUF1501 domain-containing protein, partial [Kiritimatiellae bacterium]|nr:DUF1501 domain-containing protein [Kiritimatiellia bacterium]
MNRRQWLSRLIGSSLGGAALYSQFGQLQLLQAAALEQSSIASGSDYKALVCVFLSGGNDSNNTLIPLTGTARTYYEGGGTSNTPGRGTLAIPAGNLNALTTVPAEIAAADPLGGYLGTFGVHPQLGDVRDMFNAGELAFVANVGTLTQPGITRSNYSTSSRPPQLFSHSDQVSQWQSSVPDRPFSSGWGGRIADYLDPIHNTTEGNASMSISISGVNNFMVSATGTVSPYIMSSNGVVSLSGYGTNYSSAVNDPSVLFTDSNYKNNETGKRLQAFERITQFTDSSLMENAYNNVVMSARLTEGMVGSALEVTSAGGTASTLDVHFNNAFSGAEAGIAINNSFTNQMKLVARLIAGRSALNNNRQIFFVTLGGFDTHTTQIPSTGNLFSTGHTGLMNYLNRTLKGFRDALVSEGIWDSVVAFTASDFTRTFT